MEEPVVISTYAKKRLSWHNPVITFDQAFPIVSMGGIWTCVQLLATLCKLQPYNDRSLAEKCVKTGFNKIILHSILKLKNFFPIAHTYHDYNESLDLD